MIEEFLFAEETQKPDREAPDPWLILIVDDDAEVHGLTRMVLSDFEFDGRGVSFLSAHSAREALEQFHSHPSIALAFIDVVMETETAGLDLVKSIRLDLGNQHTRLVLRTGQPGQAPARRVVRDYDINDYKEKTELTAERLYTTTMSALRGFRDLQTIERNRRGLEEIVAATGTLFEGTSLQRFCNGVLNQLVAILHLDKDLFIARGGALAATGDSESSYRVVAGTGVFSQASGQTVAEVLPQKPFVTALEHSSEREDVFGDELYVGYFEPKAGRKNLVLLKDYRKLSDLDCRLLRVFASNVAVAFDNLYLRQDILETQRELLYTLGAVVESRSKETANHVRRVAEMSQKLAEWLGMDEEEARLLYEASPMHDVGKIGIPDAILNKPGRLTLDEMATMRQHATIGYEILASSDRPMLRAGATIAYEHHEKWDGSGYPRGLRGEEIHIYGRITALADVYDALVSRRCYKEAWPVEKALEHVASEKGKHFAPLLVDAFLDNVEAIHEIQRRLAD